VPPSPIGNYTSDHKMLSGCKYVLEVYITMSSFVGLRLCPAAKNVEELIDQVPTPFLTVRVIVWGL